MTILYLYYNQPEAIKHLENVGCKEMDVKFIFIDDGSKEPLKLNWQNAEVVRIDKDVAWNQPAASNIGLKMIQGIVLKLDIDHWIRPEDLGYFLSVAQTLSKKEIVHFNRHDGRDYIRSAPNIYMAYAEDIVNCGGYDERFCGNYGYDDKELLYRLRKNEFNFNISPLTIQVRPDLHTRGLSRDTSINKKLFEKIRHEHL